MPARWSTCGEWRSSGESSGFRRTTSLFFSAAVQAEFGLSNLQYGQLVSAFSFAYAGATLFGGIFIDRIGIRQGIVWVVLAWSVVGSATGLAGSFLALLSVRTMLGVVQSPGIPASGKAVAQYLWPREFALGRALNTLCLSTGSITFYATTA